MSQLLDFNFMHENVNQKLNTKSCDKQISFVYSLYHK